MKQQSNYRIGLHVVSCPRCRKQCAATSMKFSPNLLDKSIRCPLCCKPSTSRHWKCNCEHRWHSCSKHKPLPDAHCLLNVSTRSRAPAKRPADMPTGKILDDEQRREVKHARREGREQDDGPIIELTPSSSLAPLRPGMLPPSLRAKFLVPARDALCLHCVCSACTVSLDVDCGC